MKQIFVVRLMIVLVLTIAAIGIGTGISTMPQHANAQCYACGWFSSHHDHSDNKGGSNNGGDGDNN